jgi:hypothetical protein
MRRPERQQSPLELPERLEGVYKVTEAFRSIAVAWESISAGAWSAAAIQSFAALARRVALDLSTLSCGALDRAVVDLVLALDALTVAGTVSEPQLARVDQALAGIRQVAMQRLMALDLAGMAVVGGEAPMLFQESCPRCQATGVCTILRHARRERQLAGL